MISKVERQLFEEQLRTNTLIRRAFLEVLTTKAMIEMVYERSTAERSAGCEDTLPLITKYVDADISPEQTAVLIRHVEHCSQCLSLLDRSLPSQPANATAKRRRRDVVIGILIGALLAFGFFFSDSENDPVELVRPPSDEVLLRLRPVIRRGSCGEMLIESTKPCISFKGSGLSTTLAGVRESDHSSAGSGLRALTLLWSIGSRSC